MNSPLFHLIMVNIHLKNKQNDEYIPALSIPLDDIQRLAIRPLKWLRFVTFAVCGTTGELSPTPNGLAVDYQRIGRFDSLADDYYYKPDGMLQRSRVLGSPLICCLHYAKGDYRFIDHSPLNDTNISSQQTPRRHDFHQAVLERDGVCVFTRNIVMRRI